MASTFYSCRCCIILIVIFALNYNNFFNVNISSPDKVPPSAVPSVISENGSLPPATAAPENTPAPTVDPVEENMSLAKECYEKEDYTEAIKMAEKVLSENPGNIEALLITGDAYRKKNNFHRSEEIYKKVIDLEPNNEPSHLGLGHIYRKKGETDKAIEEYKKAPERLRHIIISVLFMQGKVILTEQ